MLTLMLIHLCANDIDDDISTIFDAGPTNLS